MNERSLDTFETLSRKKHIRFWGEFHNTENVVDLEILKDKGTVILETIPAPWTPTPRERDKNFLKSIINAIIDDATISNNAKMFDIRPFFFPELYSMQEGNKSWWAFIFFISMKDSLEELKKVLKDHVQNQILFLINYLSGKRDLTNPGFTFFGNEFDRLQLHDQNEIKAYLTCLHKDVEKKIETDAKDVEYFYVQVPQLCVDAYATALVLNEPNDAVVVAGLRHINTIKKLLRQMNWESEHFR